MITSSPLIIKLKSKAMGSDKPIIYKSFLIRIWSDETGSQRRIMVTRVASNQHYYFTNLDDLMMFLLQEMEKLS